MFHRFPVPEGWPTGRLVYASDPNSMDASPLSVGAAPLLNGQSLILDAQTELLTITTAAFTDTAIKVPSGSVVLGVSSRVTSSIPGVSTFDVGVAGATTRYDNTLSALAGSTAPGTTDATRFYGAATSIRITPDTEPSAATGRVRITLHYYTVVPPTS
jgi:hypothetical protein